MSGDPRNTRDARLLDAKPGEVQGVVGLRVYAGAAGILLVLLGAAGFANAWGTVTMEGVFYALVGALFVGLSFGARDAGLVREMVGVMGAMLLLAVFLTNVLPYLASGASLPGPVQMVSLGLGLLSVLAAMLLPLFGGAERDPKGRRR